VAPSFGGRDDLPWTLDAEKVVLVGLFFNQVFPSSVGGDAVWAWRCNRLGIGVGAAIRSLVLDRVSGYSVLVMLFAVDLPSPRLYADCSRRL
jgi:uncharacterized membrane protein YbhN (UPF0104 family)